MKRFCSLFLAVLVLSLSILSLSACGGMSGTYISESGFLTYTFSSRELTVKDGYTDFDTVYTYEIEKTGSSRYILLTLKEYRYEGDNEAVAAYVEAQNQELQGKEQEAVRRYFAEDTNGVLTIGETKFVKQS